MKHFKVFQSFGTILILIAFLLLLFKIIEPLPAILIANIGSWIMVHDHKKRNS
jgi:hypothetical protein